MTGARLIGYALVRRGVCDADPHSRRSRDLVRHEKNQVSSFVFNYKAIGRNLKQNIELKPGDTVIVP